MRFLGSTRPHYWGLTRRGKWTVKRKTAKDRLDRAVKKVASWCRDNRHRPIREQADALQRKMQGHYGYYGITGNFPALIQYRKAVERAWRNWLDRRSQKRRFSWERFRQLTERFPLPRPRIVHSALAT